MPSLEYFVAILLACVTIGGLLFYFWRRQQVRISRVRYEATEALRVSEEKFRKAFLIAPDAVAITRLSDGQIISVNQGFTNILGYSDSEVIGKSSQELNLWVNPADRENIFAGLQAHGIIENYEAAFHTKSGAILAGMISAAIINLNREPHILITTRDVSERDQAQSALRASEERFRNAVLGAPFPIMIHAEDGQVININTPWSELTGYDQKDIPTTGDWTEKAYGKRMDLVRADIDKLYALDGPIAEGEYPILTRSGKTLTWDFSSAPIGRLPDGRRLVISIAMDVTERKRAEEALRLRTEELATVLDALPVFIWIAQDPACDVITGNRTANALTGMDQGIGDPQTATTIAEEVHPEEKPIRQAITLAQPVHDAEVEFRYPDGRDVYALGNVVPLFNVQGRVRGAVAAFIDITERKRQETEIMANQAKLERLFAEADLSRHTLLSVVEDQKMADDEIRRLNAELEQRVHERTAQLEVSNKELEAFAYSVSHDLRAPLRAIDGFSRILQQEYAQKLDAEGLRLLGVVRENTHKRLFGILRGYPCIWGWYNW